MSISTRKSVVLFVMVVLLAAESVYFGRKVVAGYHRLFGRRAFINSDFREASEAYRAALRWGGDRVSVKSEVLDLVIFGLLQGEAGIDLNLQLSPDEALHEARNLVAGRLQESPFETHAWMKLADLRFHEARLIRRETPINVSDLSDNVLDNLLDEERAAIEALEMATSLEPNNYFFHDLLAYFFLQIGSSTEAAPHIRRAVSSYPRLDGHIYLTEREVSKDVLESAVSGFRDATGKVSLVRMAYMQVDAGRLLMRHNAAADALTFLEQAVVAAPDLFDAHYYLGQALSRTGAYERAIEQFLIASDLAPADAFSLFHMGRAHDQLGNLQAAIDSLTAARQKRPDVVKFRHQLGELLERAERHVEAERQFVSVANMHPEDPAAWLALVRFYRRTNDHHSAQSACEQLLALDADEQTYMVHCEGMWNMDSR